MMDDEELASMTRRLAALGCAVRAFQPVDPQKASRETRAENIVKTAQRFEQYLRTAE